MSVSLCSTRPAISHPTHRFMACFNSRAPLRSLSTLQSTLRSSILAQRRPFSASQPKRFSPIDCIVWGPNLVLDGFHNLGLPWYAAIPASAIVIRATFGYFFFIRRRRFRADLRSVLTPVVEAQWRIHQMNEDRAPRTGRKLIDFSRPRYAWLLFHRMRLHFTKLREFTPRFYFLGSFVNPLVLLAAAQAIRMKCGARNGLLGMLAEGWNGVIHYWKSGILKLELVQSGFLRESALRDTEQATRWASYAEEKRQAYDAECAKLEAIQQKHQAPVTENMESVMNAADPGADSDVVLAAMSDAVRAPNMNSPYFDPSLQLEGFSWIQDLTIPDTTFGLPCLLLGVFVFTTMYRPSQAGPSSRYRFLPSTDLGKQLGLFVGVAFFMVSWNFPAAILLYMIPSVATGYLQKLYFDVTAPVSMPIKPCKMPLRRKTNMNDFI